MLRWSSSGITDSGQVRTLNEDAFLDAPDAGLWAVADGMGGHDAGDYASTLITKSLSALVPVADFGNALKNILNELTNVNQALRHEAVKRDLALIGSTVVLMLVRKQEFACVWAAFVPEGRKLAVLVVGISMLSFLALYFLAGSPEPLKRIAIVDLAGLPVLAGVAWFAFRP